MGEAYVRRLRALEEENLKPRQLVANLNLDQCSGVRSTPHQRPRRLLVEVYPPLGPGSSTRVELLHTGT